MTQNVSVVLAARPNGKPRPSDFELVEETLPELAASEILLKNHYVSLDAGFRNWMDEGSGDDVLPAMPLGAPVMGLVLGEVLASRSPEFAPGEMVMARLAWQQYSITDAGDFLVRLPEKREAPLSYYVGVLGDTGLSAYFGMTDIAKPRPGETVLVSAAGGGVGSIAGQVGQILGARAVGIAGGPEKCARLRTELHYDDTVDYQREADLDSQLRSACPDGVDVYFDNVGGALLENVLEHINEGARVVSCGAVATYGQPSAGPTNLFQLVTKQASMTGFLTHTRADRYPEARAQLQRWINAGQIVVPEYCKDGIEQVGPAFCDLFAGNNFGKTVVRL